MKTLPEKFERKAVSDAISLRFGTSPQNCHKDAPLLAERSLAELVRAVVSGRRDRGNVSNSYDLVRAEFAYGGGVFASAFYDALGQTVLDIYKQSRPNHRRWCNIAEVPTLSGKRIVIDAVASPPKVAPGGEFKHVEGGGRESDIDQSKYGRLILISWEAILADDVGMILKMISEEVSSAVRLEDDLIIAALVGATSFFLSGNNNKLTGNALDAAGLTAAISAIRVMKTAEGVDLRLSPRVLLVPAALEPTAIGLLEAYQARGGDEDGTIISVVDSRLDTSSSATSWYLAADKRQADSIVLELLAGSTEPELIKLPRKLEFDGARYRIKHICGAATVNPYGIVKSEA